MIDFEAHIGKEARCNLCRKATSISVSGVLLEDETARVFVACITCVKRMHDALTDDRLYENLARFGSDGR